MRTNHLAALKLVESTRDSVKRIESQVSRINMGVVADSLVMRLSEMTYELEQVLSTIFPDPRERLTRRVERHPSTILALFKSSALNSIISINEGKSLCCTCFVPTRFK